jgi:5'-phosphate synthase pdxT subunit
VRESIVTRIGVLALQGDFAAHATMLAGLSVEVREVRRVRDLDTLDGLIIPGGESTTLLNLMADEPWFDALKSFHAGGGALMGTCAGAILLSSEVIQPAQPSLGLLDARIARNAFGRQVDSFETELAVPTLSGSIHAVFIRAPRFVAVGPGVAVLAEHQGEPVVVRQGSVLALTFHPELTPDARLHAYFVAMATSGSMALTGPKGPAGRVS